MCPHCNGVLKRSGFLKVRCQGCKCEFNWSPISFLMKVCETGPQCQPDNKIHEIEHSD